jgi:hypothetical protein
MFEGNFLVDKTGIGYAALSKANYERPKPTLIG